jgi:hypothetical protein
MATYTLSTARSSEVRLIFGFIAGALAVVTFHQGAVALLNALGAMSNNVYSMRPVPPLGVPQVVSQAFWGGVWGIAFAAMAPRLRSGASYWLAALILGALVLPLVGWFIVAPLKGQPVAAGWVPSRMLLSVLINGAWGVGTAVIFAFLSRRSP